MNIIHVENSTCNPTSGVAFTTTSGAASSFPNLDFTFERPQDNFIKKFGLSNFLFTLTAAVFMQDLLVVSITFLSLMP